MRKWAYICLTMIIFIVDMGTKQWISHTLTVGQVSPVFHGFNLTLTHNTGAAFSFLANGSGWQRIFLATAGSLIAIGFAWWLKNSPAIHRFTCTGLALIIGGAIGNLFDRVYYGYVIDFIQLYAGPYYWPSFNVADSAICIGTGLLLIGMLRGES